MVNKPFIHALVLIPERMIFVICEKILGNMKDAEFAGKTVDYVDIEWHEAFKRLHKKTAESGREIGIRLGDDVLMHGLRSGDVLYASGDYVAAVRIPPCEVIVIDIDKSHESMAAKVCYEIGNRHAPLFSGDDTLQFITPYNEPMYTMLKKMSGVSVEITKMELNFDMAVSSAVSSHTH